MSAEKPQTMTLNWCVECGATDRRIPLGANHFYNGYRCAGEIRSLTYTLAGVR